MSYCVGAQLDKFVHLFSCFETNDCIRGLELQWNELHRTVMRSEGLVVDATSFPKVNLRRMMGIVGSFYKCTAIFQTLNSRIHLNGRIHNDKTTINCLTFR